MRHHYSKHHALRPGTVARVHGIAFQNDGRSAIGRMFIRPSETLDRWIAGIQPGPFDLPLAIHAGVHVTMDDGGEYVVEQLVGSFYLDFQNALNWTPIERFRARNHGGWDATIPWTAFRGVDEAAVEETRLRLNRIQGHPFIGEDCTAFVERAFGNRRLFADSPIVRSLGIGVRIGDPAMPLLDPLARLDETARSRLQFDRIKHLPDALAEAESLNVRLWLNRLLPIGLTAVFGWWAYSSASRRSMPASSTARRFFK
jgi:hypothetical protein